MSTRAPYEKTHTNGAKQEKTASVWEQRTFNTISNTTCVIHICHSTQLSCSAGGARICETKMIFPPPALLREFSYRPTFYFNAGISARNSSATRFAAGPSSGQKAVSCAGVLQLLHMFLLLFHCPGYERVGALTALELSAGEYRAKNPEITQIYNPLSDIFICLFKVCEFSEKVDALRTHKLLAWELEFAQQFSSAEKTPSFQLVGLNYKTQKERRGRQAGSRERHGGRAREKQRSKKTVCA